MFPLNTPEECSFTIQNTSSTYLKTEATCTSPATYYYSCECGAKGTATFTLGSALGHSYDWTDYCGTCEYYYGEIKCNRCNDVVDSQPHSSHNHSYTPSNATVTVLGTESGADIDQTFTTSNYMYGWKVFKNNSGQLDIISAESVGTLRLQGAVGYAKAVYTLNKMSEGYVNPTYATSGRSLGYKDGSSIEILDINTYPLNGEGSGLPYSDSYYSDDKTIVNTSINGEFPLRQTIRDTWLASRYKFKSSGQNSYYYTIRYLDINGGNSYYQLYRPDKTEDIAASYGVRPVISLKSELTIIGGDGTQANPYVLQ